MTDNLLRPTVGRVGTRRKNFGSICQLIDEDPAKVSEYILKELGTTGNLVMDNALLIMGFFSPSQLEHLLKTYIDSLIDLPDVEKNGTAYLSDWMNERIEKRRAGDLPEEELSNLKTKTHETYKYLSQKRNDIGSR